PAVPNILRGTGTRSRPIPNSPASTETKAAEVGSTSPAPSSSHRRPRTPSNPESTDTRLAGNTVVHTPGSVVDRNPPRYRFARMQRARKREPGRRGRDNEP